MVNLWIVLGAPLVRALAGWLQKAMADGVVDWPELRELVQTVLKLGVPVFALVYGFELDEATAASLVVVIDYALWMIKDAIQKVKAKKS